MNHKTPIFNVVLTTTTNMGVDGRPEGEETLSTDRCTKPENYNDAATKHETHDCHLCSV